jgi:hypothetical protein
VITHYLAADMCRRAAARIRELAEAATPGPWTSLDNGDRLIHEHNDDTDDITYVVDEPMSNAANAAHIAAWSPPAALAVAALLDATVEQIEAAAGFDMPLPSVLWAAVRVAEAFLRAQPGKVDDPEEIRAQLADLRAQAQGRDADGGAS